MSNSKRISGALTEGTTKRITAAITEDSTKRVGENPAEDSTLRVTIGQEHQPTYDVWNGSWANSWLYSWFVGLAVSALGYTERVVANYSGDALLQEDGTSYILLEDGSKLLLEDSTFLHTRRVV